MVPDLTIILLLIMTVYTEGMKFHGNIEAVIHMSKLHPHPSQSVKESFNQHMDQVKKTIERYSAVGIPILKRYASFMKNQECRPVCAAGKC